tara:strand:- start:690 stop:1238 length:549 start_codon:yes stop_codon:yes gene_type:complete
MKAYHKKFKTYLDDLGKRAPSPGGGSAVCLIACLAFSLIEKAFNYSVSNNPKTALGKRKNLKLKKDLTVFKNLRKKILPSVYKDAIIFAKVMESKGRARAGFLVKADKLMVEVSESIIKGFSLAKSRESDIKKNIISDYSIGRECLLVALGGCLKNLAANSLTSGKKNKHIKYFTKTLKKWQ